VGRTIDLQMQSDLLAQNGAVAGLQTQQTALQSIDAVTGTVAGGSDIGSLLGTLQDAFSTLQEEPDSQTQQQQVVTAAQALAAQINAVSNAVSAQRQSAQNAIVSGVGQLNATLATLGSLSNQIILAKTTGQSTADLENQRDVAENALSQQLSVKFFDQPNGDLLAVAAGGISLPIHNSTPPFSTAAATIGATSYAGGSGVPPILLGGQDVTADLAGSGQLGADITLRDSTLPTIQANLDEFSANLSSRFAQQGLTLFTDPSGNVPSTGGSPVQAGYLGYAGTIQVNAAVIANPSSVRDGNTAIAGSPTGATAFTPNPPGGPAGFTGLISRVLLDTFGSDVQTGVPQPAPAVAGLGASGTLSAGFAAPPDLAGLAAAVTGAEAQQSATVTSQLATEQAVQATYQAQVSATSAVNMDTEMSQMIVLQNAYGANARVMSTVQAMFTQLLQAVSS
jgi:flagellar hook-associated protein 1 FlgK